MEKIYLIIFHQQSQIWIEMDFSEFRRTPEVSGLNISSNILVFVFYLLYRYLVSENNNKDDNKAHYVLRKRAQKNVFPVGQTKAARFWKIPVATDHGEVSFVCCVFPSKSRYRHLQKIQTMKYLELWRNELVLKLRVTPLFLRFKF